MLLFTIYHFLNLAASSKALQALLSKCEQVSVNESERISTFLKILPRK
jgi:hypothetical protein